MNTWYNTFFRELNINKILFFIKNLEKLSLLSKNKIKY